jgi:diguanylate cyclase (GGDEF)-like protein
MSDRSGEMLLSSLFSILFVSVCVVMLACGILVLQKNHQAPANRGFFALIMALNFWSAGLALATNAPDAATCEMWRRFSALGWGTAYAVLLHFILIITGSRAPLKKWWFYPLLYLPAAITVFAFAIPNDFNPFPYQLHYTQYGWVNVAENNAWDWFFYAYYIAYTVAGLLLLWRWGKKARDLNIKKQSRNILLAIIAALILASFTDVLLSSMYPILPQMAPAIMLVPILAVYHTLKKDSFKIDELHRSSSYVNIIAGVTLYVIISFYQFLFLPESEIAGSLYMEESTIRGVLLQIQMLISIWLVLKENKPGYVASLLMNATNLIHAFVIIIRSMSPAPLPALFSYAGVMMITTLIKLYKDKTAEYIERINSQRNSLEESEQKLYKMAYYDSLTGLPNRELFMEHLNHSILMARRNATMVGVLFVDFDSFKSVNDLAGHVTGDLVLWQAAQLISSCLREEDTMARFGGDEFLIKVSNVKRLEDISKTVKRIKNVLKEPITVQDVEYFISASIGVAIYPIDGEDPETLIRNADIAMYSAKSKGKNQCVFCTAEIKEDIIKKLKLTNSLYRALDKNELSLQYQPLVKVETLEICGFEVLLRWNNEEYGQIPPKDFIPLAEQTGLIKPIGLWVIRTACEQLKLFQDYFHKELSIAINLSLLQLKDPGIADDINAILKATSTDAKNIQIEITESSAFKEEPFLLERLQEIKKRGASIAIDDFGTGHSSLSRLQVFPIDLIKIGTEFVRGISSRSNKDRAIIKSIIQIAKNLGVEVVAEGVETEEQFIYLRDSACDKVQGYYFYKPMSAGEIMSILNELKNMRRR